MTWIAKKWVTVNDGDRAAFHQARLTFNADALPILTLDTALPKKGARSKFPPKGEHDDAPPPPTYVSHASPIRNVKNYPGHH